MSEILGKTLYDLINPQIGGIRPASWDEVDEDHHAHYARCESSIWNKAVEECAKVADQDTSFQMLQDWGLQTTCRQVGVNIRDAILSLKKGNTDERG